MRKVTEDIKVALGTIASKKERKKIRKALREAMDRVQKALAKNPQFAPLGMLPLGEENPAGGEPASTPSKRKAREEISLLKDPRNPRQAFERQSKLLRDAFIEEDF